MNKKTLNIKNFYVCLIHLNYQMRSFLFICIVFHSFLLFSQDSGNFKFIHYSNNNGLIHNDIYNICQDNEGYMWIGSTRGVCRFDGYNFYEYTKKQGFLDHSLNGFCMSKNGTLWMGKSYLYEYDNDKDYLHHYSDSSFNNSEVISQIRVDASENLWLVKDEKLILFSKDKKMIHIDSVSTFDHKRFSANKISSILIDSKNILWIGTLSKQIWWIDLNTYYQTKQFIVHTYTFDYYTNYKFNDYVINPLLEDNNHNIWFGNKLVIYDRKTNTFIPAKKLVPDLSFFYDDESYYPSCIVQDINNNIWIGTTSNGLFRFSIQYNTILHFDEKNIISNNIVCLFIDKSENLWVGGNTGIDILNLYNKKMIHYTYKCNTIKTNSVNAIFQDNAGNLYFAAGNNGLLQIDKNNKYHNFQRSHHMLSHLFLGNTFNSIVSYKSLIFLGGPNLNLLNTESGEIQYCNPGKNSYTDWEVWKIDKGIYSGDYWIASQHGLNRLYSKTIKEHLLSDDGRKIRFEGKFDVFLHHDNDTNSLLENKLWYVYESSAGKVFIGTTNGLSIYDIPSKTFKNFKTDTVHPNGFNGFNVSIIFEDSKKNCWIGTEEAGFCLYNQKENNFTHYTTKEGLSDNTIWGILEDSSGFLWISTENGLNKFDPRTHLNRIYTSANGFLNDKYNRGAFYKDNQGALYFGGYNGVDKFLPEDISDNPIKPNVILCNLYLFNNVVIPGETYGKQVVLRKQLNKEKKIVLDYYNKMFSIEFSSDHYSQPEANKYKYMLEGFDKEWLLVNSTQRSAHYNNLPVGNYTLMVQACNPDGIWGPERRLIIVVLPPFWETWWFRCLVILIISGFIYVYYIYRMIDVKKRNILLERLVKDRTYELGQQKEQLSIQADSLHEINILLRERQEEIEAASEKLSVQSKELYSANQDLLRLNATKDKFFSIIAHDLKNPFQGILSFSELLYNKYEEYNDADKKNFIKIICDSSKGAFGLLENLLEWSRSQTNKIQFDPREINIYEIIAETIHILTLNANNKHITLINESRQGMHAFADKNMMTTVIRNLINNAIKFTPSGGKITVDSKVTEDMIEIKISDTGVGMDEHVVLKLFKIDQNPFTTGTSGESGTGLGLIICKEFVDKNNGTIRVDSKIGNGTTFFISLPVSENKFQLLEHLNNLEFPVSILDEDEPIILNDDLETDGESKVILIIEDNPNIRLNIRQAFLKGYEIKEASNGKEGLETALEFIPDLIISDVMMPEMDGFELCSTLKKDERTSHIPVILLTARVSDNSRMKGLETGADDYITKPFNIEVLKVRVKNLLRSRTELQKRFSKEIYLQPLDIPITSADAIFIQKALQIIEKHISESSFSVESFSKELGISTQHLYRKLKGLTGESTNDFIRSIRLKRAVQLLISTQKSVSEISFEIGFNDTKYFSKVFKDIFGMNPTEYRNSEKKSN